MASEEQPAQASRKNYGKKAKVGAMWSVGRESVTQLIGIPTTLILARLLSPSDFGIAAAATFFIQLGKRLGNMGLNTALVRMHDVREEHRASVFTINLVFGLLAWAALMLAAPHIGAFYGDERVVGAVRVASTIFLVNFFGAVEYAVLQRDMKFKEMALVEWTQPAVFLPVSVGLAWAGWGFWALLLGQVVSNAASTASKMYFGRWRPSLAVTRAGIAETVPFGMGVYAKRLLTYAAENLDSLVVGGLFGVTSLGYYDKAFNAADNLSNRLSVGSTVMFRIFAIIRDERERFVRAYSKVVLAGTFATLPVFAGLFVASREFIIVVFGEQWLAAVVPFQLLCAAGAMRLLTSYASAAVQASGQIWGEVWRKVAQVALIVGLVLAFRRWGIEGAALGVLISSLILTLLMQGLVRRIVGLTWWEMWTPLWPSVVAATMTASVVAVTTAAIRSWAPASPDWLVLILQAAAGGVSWIAFALFAPLRSLQDVVDEILDDVVPRFARRQVDRIRRRPTRPHSA
jgi:PST family polysaccharide transporter